MYVLTIGQCSRFLLLMILACSWPEAYAQLKPLAQNDSIYLKKYAGSASKELHNSSPYYLAVFKNKEQVTGKIIRQLQHQVFIIQLDDSHAYESWLRQAHLTPANDQWKWSPALEQQTDQSLKERKNFILSGLDIDELLKAIKQHPLVEVLTVNRPSHSLRVKTTGKYIREHLLTLNEIIFIDAAMEARSETRLIGYDRSLHGINALDFQVPAANGKNIVTGIKEQKMDPTDLDLWKRVIPSSLAAATTSYHATVIATLIGGAGNSFYDGRGIAWGCRFFTSSFDNLFADDAAVLNSNNVSVQNHSYGTVIQQFYGAEALSYDLLSWSNKEFVPVISAGNQGESFATEGRYSNLAGFANLTGNFKMAKNVLTVGAIDKRENIPVQSSAGPLYDGRIAPQITALGPNGTSDAAALVSGAVAVLQQVYKDSNNVLPPASLIKAILYNTADDIHTPGIDYKTGYGLLNAYAAVKTLQRKNYSGGMLTNGAEWTKAITVPSNAAALKVTLAWTDTASQVNNSRALMNDLDLQLVQINTGAVSLPWVLSAAAQTDSLKKQPTRKRDSLNTAEQVSIRFPAAGMYEIRVRAAAMSNPSIAFHVAYQVDTLNTFSFISPLHASDVIREEQDSTAIRWKTELADSLQTADLSISFNNGNTWQLLAQPRLLSKMFSWPVKDTNSIARLKMQTSFGSFLSNDFLVGTLTRLRVDFNCADSFGLSWNKQPLANGYRLFTLSDSPYLKPIQVITDTFVVLNSASHPSLVYAVEPIINSGPPAARSVAIDISMQSVNCFYKALNYNLLDENKLNLILELSVSRYVDSVFFERVTASGQLLELYGVAKASATRLIYTQLVNELQVGITYLRARIKLSNAAIVYTDIIPVLTSGPNMIHFYPNPVTRNSTLQYSLRQGVATSAKLQLYDITGRLLMNFSSMPGIVDVSRLKPGMILYRLLTADNQVLETGKLIVL